MKTFETLYETNEKVWILINNKPIEAIVHSLIIHVFNDNMVIVDYALISKHGNVLNKMYNEINLFRTKDELLNSIK